GGRDEDVRRFAEHRLALALRGVAGAHRHRQIGADAAQRHAQVAVDVVGEGLERRDVDEADVPLAATPRIPVPLAWLAGQLVDRPQERGQRLARPRRRGDQDVLATGNRRPGLGLRRGWRGERAGKPLARAWRELLEGHYSSVPIENPASAPSRSVPDRITERPSPD